jgi:DNA replication and repair protein RecF
MTGEKESPTLLYLGCSKTGGDYEDVAKTEKELYQLLSSHHEREIGAGATLWGIHKDDIDVELNGHSARLFCSQGQQRSIVLAWKLAEVETVEQVLHVKPVLLLDDVMSELDEKRRSMLVQLVDEDIQTFITATDLDGLAPSLVDRARVITLPLE